MYMIFYLCSFIDPHLTTQHLKIGDCFKTSHLLKHACLTDYYSGYKAWHVHNDAGTLAPWVCLAGGMEPLQDSACYQNGWRTHVKQNLPLG